jgi:ArsR family metal-binding transcriptional regulator
MNFITTFPAMAEFEKAKKSLNELGLKYRLIDPTRTYSRVGLPAIALDEHARIRLAESKTDFICSGWVDGQDKNTAIPINEPPLYSEDIFGKAYIIVLAHCVADASKIRLIAHTEKDISLSFPYINALRNDVSFNKEWPILSFMDGYRMITLYQNRITAAKLDDIFDGWRVLEKIRRLVNDTYGRRKEIEPSYEMRRRPPVLEIFKRLPGTNCRECGEASCMAFASRVWSGDKQPSGCTPVLLGEYIHLKDAFLQICTGMGTWQMN